MKRIIYLSIVISIFFVISANSQKLSEAWEKPAPEFQSPSFCSADGDGGDRALNRAKNRIDEPTFYHAVGFTAIRDLHSADAAAERDRDTLPDDQKQEIAKYEGIPVRVTGYLKFGRKDTITDPNFVGVEKKTAESCNCHSDKDDEVDYHLTLINKPSNEFRDAIVVEMAPRVRAKHPTWNLPNLREYARKGYQVRIFGFLMFDGEHKELMFDPKNPNKPRVRRATLWEIHPITRFEVKIGGVWKIL